MPLRDGIRFRDDEADQAMADEARADEVQFNEVRDLAQGAFGKIKKAFDDCDPSGPPVVLTQAEAAVIYRLLVQR